MTQQRKLIGQVIRDSSQHMTAEQIYIAAKARLPSIAIGTVYRNLGLMSSSGEILRIEIPGQPDHFDKTVVPHHHCFCVNCGDVEDVPVPDLKPMLERMTGTSVESYDLTLRVLCPVCREKRTR